MLYRLWLAKNAECSADSDIPARFWFVPVFLNDLFFYRLNSFCLWDCARAGPAEFRHHFKAFLFQNSALFTNKSTKENLLTETENSKFEIQNTNPDRMQSGMFSSVFILNALFDLSDDLSTFRASLARPGCELYTVFKAKQVSAFQVCSCFIFDSREMYYSLTAFLDIAVAVCYLLWESGDALPLQVKMLLFPLSGTQQASCRRPLSRLGQEKVVTLFTSQHLYPYQG